MKTVAIELPVLRRPDLRRSIQPWRSPSGLGVGRATVGGVLSVVAGRAGASWSAGASRSAGAAPKDLRSQPMAPPLALVSVSGGGAAGVSMGASAGAVDFFLKKLNIGWVLRIAAIL